MKKIIPFFILGCLAGAIIVKVVERLNFEIPVPVATLPDGGVYAGDLVNGTFAGEGRMRWPDGSTYEGSFKDGMFHGQGRYLFADGGSYEGDFTDGAMTGAGTFIYSEDGKYVGAVVNGHANGKGTLYTNGDKYEGDFKDDKYHGSGVFTQENGDVYTGEFKDGFFHGKGEYVTADSRVYSGEFVKGSFSGRGSYKDEEGSHYEGEFEDWTFHGEGRLKDENGDYYIGTFNDGALYGEGEFIGHDGEHYQGEFEYSVYNGRGRFKSEAGDIYEGEFRYGQYHGAGTLTYAKPLDNMKEVKGTWRNGHLVNSEDKSLLVNPAELTEITLYNQNELLAGSWRGLQQNDPDKIDMYFLGISGDGTQAVFRREVLFVKNYFDNNYGTGGKSVVLINARKTVKEIPLATYTSIKKTLPEIVKRMDHENDILFIYMSSHGSSDFEFSLNQSGVDLQNLPAGRLAELLADLPVKWKVIVISACYSGGFIPPLQDDNTLIITAASAERQSFGCSDRAEFTYFGEAFFKEALPESESFVAAFDKALEIIHKREEAEEYKHSEPQIHKPAPILQQLQQWRAGLNKL